MTNTDIILFVIVIMILLVVIAVLGFVASAILEDQDDIRRTIHDMDMDIDELWFTVFSPDDDDPDEEDVDTTSNIVAFGRKSKKAA